MCSILPSSVSVKEINSSFLGSQRSNTWDDSMNKYHQLEDFSFFLKKKDVWTHYLGLDAVFFLSFHPPSTTPCYSWWPEKGTSCRMRIIPRRKWYQLYLLVLQKPIHFFLNNINIPQITYTCPRKIRHPMKKGSANFGGCDLSKLMSQASYWVTAPSIVPTGVYCIYCIYPLGRGLGAAWALSDSRHGGGAVVKLNWSTYEPIRLLQRLSP